MEMNEAAVVVSSVVVPSVVVDCIVAVPSVVVDCIVVVPTELDCSLLVMLFAVGLAWCL